VVILKGEIVMGKKNLPAVVCVCVVFALGFGAIFSQADRPKDRGYQSPANGQSLRVDAPKVQEVRQTSSTPPLSNVSASPSKRAAADGLSGETVVPTPAPASASTPVAADGLSYETYIPRPTQKGYYEPKVVPYPVGKPVHVSGYYRRDGTFVQPHFRSLPRR
jgi:hypothetical protein